MLPESLVYLRWTNGLFACCPVDFNRLEKLVALELVDCKSMKSLPPSVVKASKLIWLELGGCQSLVGLPLGLSTSLEHLGVNNTILKNLPSDLRKFKGLRHLQANETHLTQVPQGLCRLDMLSSLNLRGTRLTTLPESLGDLKRLTKLDRGETMVSSLPESIGRLQELEFLNLWSTKLGSLPESIGELKRLTELHLGFTKVTSLPESIGELKRLTELDLHDTKVTSLPESIGGLQSLKILDLGFPHVKSLPQSLGELFHLERLDCKSTPLETLPDSIGELLHLSCLNLEYTQIGRLPDAVEELLALNELSVVSPRLRVWLKTTGRLSRLQKITVDLGALCENTTLSLQPGEVEGREEENALAAGDGKSQMAIHSFLSQVPLLRAVSDLPLRGSDLPEYWLRPLFLTLQHMQSLESLTLLRFNLVEIIPCELGTLTKLKSLILNSFKTLRELPKSLDWPMMLEELWLFHIPKLCRLPESLSALPSLSQIFITRCANLQNVPRSFSCKSPSESESSTSEGRHYRHLDSVKPIRIDTQYSVPCTEMEILLKKAIKGESSFVLDMKVAREILTERGLRYFGDDNGQHESSRPYSSNSVCRCRVHHQCLTCDCVCNNNRYLKVTLQEGRDETENQMSIMDLHQESDEDTKDEEALVMKYLRFLWSCLLCSG